MYYYFSPKRKNPAKNEKNAINLHEKLSKNNLLIWLV